MAMRVDLLKPYPKMKNSGVKWLGEVPEHWDVRRLRTAVKLLVSNVDKHTKHGEMPVRLCNYTDIQREEFIHGGLDFMRATATPEEIEKLRLLAGDVLITKDAQVGIPALVTEIAGDVIPGYHTAILRPSVGILSGGYLFRAAQSRAVFSQFKVEAVGVTLHGISHAKIKSIQIPLPPMAEQVGIVRFLDSADARLDRAVRAKRKVIALLNEQKQAVIHRAVTRGLDDSVTLKPSGIPWVGDIPKHWEVRPIKHWAQINARTLGQSTDPNFEFKYIDIGMVQTGHLIRQPELMQFANAPSRARRILADGDTIVSTVRTYLKAVWFAGKNADNLIASTGFAVFSPNAGVEPEYLHYVLQDAGFVNQVTANSVGIAYPAIAESVLARFRVALPASQKEQREVIAAIKNQTRPISVAISRLEREIELLREYRARLVADVVTGKVDVREAAAQLPDKTPPAGEQDENESDNGDFAV